MAKIKMKTSVTVAETFLDFLTAKKAAGVSEKTFLPLRTTLFGVLTCFFVALLVK